MEYTPPDSNQQGGKSKGQDEASSKDWGGGQKLGRGSWKPSEVIGAGGASVPVIPDRSVRNAPNQAEKEKARSPSPDWGVEEDDDMIDYYSD